MELRRGMIRSFDSTTFRADVQLDGSVPTWLTGARISRAIPSTEMLAGRSCIVAFASDPSDPTEAVVIAVYT
ncbi:MAG: hypothetical protein F4X20_03800 [Dehalococcoidia bacterium]|nr:hypothetical protein [Dehalococcoidia bacterium]